MGKLTLGATLAALLMVLFGGTAAAQDREETRRSGARSAFSGLYLTHTVREGENLTTTDRYDGPGGMIQHYFGHRRDGLIAELRRYDTNWRTIREWCNWPEDVPRAERTGECPQDYLRYSIRRSVGRTIFIPLSLIEREARRDRSPGYRELEPEERVTRHLRELAAADPGFRRQLETLGTAHAAYVAAGSPTAPETAPDVTDVPAADDGAETDGADMAFSAEETGPTREELEAQIAERQAEIDRLTAETSARERELAEAHAAIERLTHERDERWEPETVHASMAGTGLGGFVLGLLLLGFVGVWRRPTKRDDPATTTMPWEEANAGLAKTIEGLQKDVEAERELAGQAATLANTEKALREAKEQELAKAIAAKAAAESAKGEAEAAVRRIGVKLGAHQPDAETVEKRAARIFDFANHAAMAFGVQLGDVPAIQKETMAYAQLKASQGGGVSEKDEALRRLSEETRQLKQRLSDIESGAEVPTRYAGIQLNLEQAERELEDERQRREQVEQEQEALRRAHAEELKGVQASTATLINETNRAHTVEVARLQARIVAKGELLEAMQPSEDAQCAALRELAERQALQIEQLEAALAGQAFDELRDHGANGSHAPPGTVIRKLDELDDLRARSKTEPPPGGNGAGEGLPSLPPEGTKPGVAAPSEGEGGAEQAVAGNGGRVRRSTATYGLNPDGDAEAEAAAAAEAAAVPGPAGVPAEGGNGHDPEPTELENAPTVIGPRPTRNDEPTRKVVTEGDPEDKIICGCGRGVKRKNWEKHKTKCAVAKASDIEAGAAGTEK